MVEAPLKVFVLTGPQAPVTLDVRSPLDLVYECFVKLGLRYICVSRDGKYAGLVSDGHGNGVVPMTLTILSRCTKRRLSSTCENWKSRRAESGLETDGLWNLAIARNCIPLA